MVYKTVVQLESGLVTEDTAILQDAYAQAQIDEYGKLQPALYRRLEEINDDDRLPVALWLAGGPLRNQAELYEALAQRYPEARTQLEATGKPWGVADPDLASRIRAEYWAMAEADNAARIAPLVAYLQTQGIEARTYGPLPSVTANLTKRQILDAASREDVATIYLIEEPGHAMVLSALDTDRVYDVWDRGYSGTGVDIAILEADTIDPSADWLSVSQVFNPRLNISDHKTIVAGIVASHDLMYDLKGAAPSANLLDASFPTGANQADAVAALQWAVDTKNAPVVNVSYGWEYSNALEWSDRAFDFWSRYGDAFVTVAAGNSFIGTLSSPAKGWNVMAVGGFADRNNGYWSDDVMGDYSSYVNPTSAWPYDREKPEVVAVGSDITMRGVFPGAPIDNTNTSFSTPQVAGLAALLIDREAALAAYPEALRAIIMASASHNIVGPTGIPSSSGDLKDGAGGIDAAFADDIAQHRCYGSLPTTPCAGSFWQAVPTQVITVSHPLEVYFTSNMGTYFRVAISWWSLADSASTNYGNDILATDLDLLVQYQSGAQWIQVPNGSSHSYWNNYELVEGIAPVSGLYRISVTKPRCCCEQYNSMGQAVLQLVLPPNGIIMMLMSYNP